MHRKPHPTPRCKVLPPGEFNRAIPEPLSVFLKGSWRQL